MAGWSKWLRITLMVVAIAAIGRLTTNRNGLKAPPRVESNPFEMHESGFIFFCREARRPCGILVDKDQPFDPPAKPVHIPGADIKQVMDTYLQAVPSYRWEVLDGILVISPRSISREVSERFYKTPINARFDALPSDEAAYKVMETAKMLGPLFTSGVPYPYGTVTVAFNGDSAFSALNTLAKKDGLAMWVVGYYPGWINTHYTFNFMSWRDGDPPNNKPSRGTW